MCLATDEAYFVLKYNANVVAQARETNTNISTEDGVEDAFEVTSKLSVAVDPDWHWVLLATIQA